jgi:hypothetical protein
MKLALVLFTLFKCLEALVLWGNILPPESGGAGPLKVFLDSSSIWDQSLEDAYSRVMIAKIGVDIRIANLLIFKPLRSKDWTGFTAIEFSAAADSVWIGDWNGLLWKSDSRLLNWQNILPAGSIIRSLLFLDCEEEMTLLVGTEAGQLLAISEAGTMEKSESAVLYPITQLQYTRTPENITILGYSNSGILLSVGRSQKTVTLRIGHGEELSGMIVHFSASDVLLIIGVGTTTANGQVIVYSLQDYTQVHVWSFKFAVTQILMTSTQDYEDRLIVGCADGSAFSILLDSQLAQWYSPQALLNTPGSRVTAIAFNWMVNPQSVYDLWSKPILLLGYQDGSIEALFPNSTTWQKVASSGTWQAPQSVSSMVFASQTTNEDNPQESKNYLLVTLSQGEVELRLPYADDVSWNFLVPTPSQSKPTYMLQSYDNEGFPLLNLARDNIDDLLQRTDLKITYLDHCISYHQIKARIAINAPFFAILTTSTNPNFKLVISVVGVRANSDQRRSDNSEVIIWNPDKNSQFAGNSIIPYTQFVNFPYNTTLTLQWSQTIYAPIN